MRNPVVEAMAATLHRRYQDREYHGPIRGYNHCDCLEVAKDLHLVAMNTIAAVAEAENTPPVIYHGAL